MEASSRAVSSFSALVAFVEQVNLQICHQSVRFEGEFVWADVQLGLSQVSTLRNSKMATFQGFRL